MRIFTDKVRMKSKLLRTCAAALIALALAACAATPEKQPTLAPAPVPTPVPAEAPWQPLPRSAWTAAQPDLTRVPMMGEVTRIVIRHEGWKPVTFEDKAATIERLEAMRKVDVAYRHRADISHHYMIDRAGRAWECRPVDHQGSMVADGGNAHTIEVMVLGNFDEQTMTAAQEAELHRALLALCLRYHLPASAIYGKCEMKALIPAVSTTSPGRHVMERLVPMREQLAKELSK